MKIKKQLFYYTFVAIFGFLSLFQYANADIIDGTRSGMLNESRCRNVQFYHIDHNQVFHPGDPIDFGFTAECKNPAITCGTVSVSARLSNVQTDPYSGVDTLVGPSLNLIGAGHLGGTKVSCTNLTQPWVRISMPNMPAQIPSDLAENYEAAATCEDTIVIQTSNCGTQRSAHGTKDCSIDGVCGTSNGKTLTIAPATGLCTQVTASAVSGDGPWTWSCYGSGGGTTASCSANKTVEPQCTGSFTNSTLCVDDDSELTIDTAKTLVDTCSTPAGSTPKCETTCNSGYQRVYYVGTDSHQCDLIPPYSCTGSIPNSTLCAGDNTGLTSDVAKTAVTACSSPAGSDPKCEMVCNTGYVKSENSCAVLPPEISGIFNVSDVPTGEKPTASWEASNSVRCNLLSDTGYSDMDVCDSVSDCASVSVLVDKPVMTETNYTLNCYSIDGTIATAQAKPLARTVLTATPAAVTTNFYGGGAFAEPKVALKIVSWNGFNDTISFSSDISTSLPESPGSDTTNSVAFVPSVLTFANYYPVATATPSMAEIFASYRFDSSVDGSKTVKICRESSVDCASIEVTGVDVIGEDPTNPAFQQY